MQVWVTHRRLDHLMNITLNSVHATRLLPAGRETKWPFARHIKMHQGIVRTGSKGCAMIGDGSGVLIVGTSAMPFDSARFSWTGIYRRRAVPGSISFNITLYSSGVTVHYNVYFKTCLLESGEDR